jgi:UDP-N-acetylglucosamine--N-acetylmuramyl-(pentapeptide) pyrophosphoryl-undecaprenol N-acetylglucosamine transferase
MRRALNIVLAGGGSGGHVYPALAIGEIARERFPEARFLFIGTRRGAEATIVPARGIEIAYISIESFRKSAVSMGLFGAALLRAAWQARRIMNSFRPDLVIASGGYASAPVVLAAALPRKPGAGRPKIFVHEQNVVAGLANRLAGRFADRVGTTFAESGRYFPARRTLHVGYPLRSQITAGGREEARRVLGIDGRAFVVFAFGGSAGSRTINRAVADGLDLLLEEKDLHVIHAVGRYRGADYDPKKDTQDRLDRRAPGADLLARYHPLEYTETIGTTYSAADLVVCRCGSGTLFELRRAMKPSILVPKLGSAGEHQLANALSMEREGFAVVLRESRDEEDARGVMKVDGALLAGKILEIKRDPRRLEEMHRRLTESGAPDSRTAIGDALESLVNS